MVEIKIYWLRKRFSEFKNILNILLLLSVPFKAYSQDVPQSKKSDKKVEIIYADTYEVNEEIDKNLQRLLGNVKLKHKEVTMSCDSAWFYKNQNQVKAFSKIHIEQGDTLDLYGNYLFYDGTLETAHVEDDVILIDKETHLYTDAIDYDVKNRIARYEKNGRITNADNTLTSIIGIYYISDNMFHFKDSVKIVNPDYVMTADTMDYNTRTETAFFTGPSELKGDSIYLYCENGWYDTKNEITSIWKNAVIDNMEQIVHGDSLFFNDNTGFGESFGNVVIEDTVKNLLIMGNYAWYYKHPEKFTVTDRAVFVQISDGDSLFLHADTISTVTVFDTTGSSYRLMRAYNGCRIFSADFQSKCDSLSYSFQDSVIRFYTLPVIWSEDYQLTADSMAIFTKNRKAERLELYNSAFITNYIDSLNFNQIKGRSLTGYFKDNELFKIDIRGNGESIYYLLDGNDIAGVNQTKCANIEAFLVDGKISEINEYQNPEGVIDPPTQTDPGTLRLDGFSWLDKLRPRNRNDIFRK